MVDRYPISRRLPVRQDGYLSVARITIGPIAHETAVRRRVATGGMDATAYGGVSMRLAVVSAIAVLSACTGPGGMPPVVSPARVPAPLPPTPLYREIVLDTADGLSGLAKDAHGAMWTVAERADRVYRITLDAAMVPTISAFVVEGVPERNDLEGIEVLDDDHFAFGTEGKVPGIATVLLAHREDSRILVDRVIDLPESQLGLPIPGNQGAEGICHADGTLVVAIEATGVVNGRRWAPIAFVEGGVITRVDRLFLTSATGKLSALDCVRDGAVIHAWAIERHFETTHLVAFDLGPESRDIVPTVLLDLTHAVAGKLNIEGLVRLAAHRFAAVVDNQWKVITGPNELLLFAPVTCERAGVSC